MVKTNTTTMSLKVTFYILNTDLSAVHCDGVCTLSYDARVGRWFCWFEGNHLLTTGGATRCLSSLLKLSG